MRTMRFMPKLDQRRRSLAQQIARTTLRAADSGAALAKHFDHGAHSHPTHVLAFGKAAIAMTNAAIELLGDRFVRATVLAPPALCADFGFKSKLVELLPADHPLPTPRNVHAAQVLGEHAMSIPEDHDAIVLISGGGSAMLCAPKPRVTLEEIIETTRSMLRAGAPIGQINAARARLETLKGGGLAKLLGHVRQSRAYVLSDVIGDDLETIASGPLIDRHPPRIRHTLIAGNDTAIDALLAWCAIEGVGCASPLRHASGQSDDEGRRLAQTLLATRADAPCAACMGGEPTVDTAGSEGVGGPMLELAVSAALELAPSKQRWSVIALTTDGIDGPTDAMGAIITSDMLDNPLSVRAAQMALREHNTLPICDTLGGTIRTGPTGTNINDIAIAIRHEHRP